MSTSQKHTRDHYFDKNKCIIGQEITGRHIEIIEVVETEWYDATRDVVLYMNEIREII